MIESLTSTIEIEIPAPTDIYIYNNIIARPKNVPTFYILVRMIKLYVSLWKR